MSLPAVPDAPAADPFGEDAPRFGVFICEVEGEPLVVAEPPEVAGEVAVPVDPALPVVPVAPVVDGEPVAPDVLPVVPWACAVPTASAMASVSADNAAREVFMRSLLMLVSGSKAGTVLLQHVRHLALEYPIARHLYASRTMR